MTEGHARRGIAIVPTTIKMIAIAATAAIFIPNSED